MKKIKFLPIGLIFLGAIITTSCRKKGCTDPNSTSFNSKAKKDDGTCKYQGETVFWYSQTTADSLLVNGATNLTFYVDGQVVGSTATSVYWTGAPNCGDNASITVTKDLGSVKTQSYSYSIKDQTGFEYWKGTLNFNANTCSTTELTY